MTIPKLTSENVKCIFEYIIKKDLDKIEQQRIERETKAIQKRIKQFLEEYDK